MEIENADKLVLLQLLQNARTPLSKIAKTTGLTREIVAYRMKKLEKSGVIKGYIARINQAHFCKGVGTLLCKLQRTDEEQFQQTIKHLQQYKAINWVAELCGTYDLVMTFLYNSPEDLANVVGEISQYMGSSLKEHHLSLFISEYKFSREGIITETAETLPNTPVVHFKDPVNLELDEKDKTLLAHLAGNCRITNKEMAKHVGLSEDMIRLRIKKLEEQKVILGYTVVLDVNALGFESYYLGMQLENMTEKTLSKLSYFMQTNPYVGHCARAAGKYNVIVSLYAKNRAHFNELLIELRKMFGNEMISYEFQMNLKEHKEVFVPGELIIS